MSNGIYGAVVKICIVVLLILSLNIGSCKKSSDDSSSRENETEKIEQQKDTVDANTDNSTTEKASPVTSGVAPIAIKLPKPMFVGTPQNIRVHNLEKPLGKARPPFLAPVGTKNVAFGKSVASSDEEPIIGEIELITDGDKEAADGSYVELGPFLQHVY